MGFYHIDIIGNLFNGAAITRFVAQDQNHRLDVSQFPDGIANAPSSPNQVDWRPKELRWGTPTAPQAIPFFDLIYEPKVTLNKMYLRFALRGGLRDQALNTDTAELVSPGHLRWWTPNNRVFTIRSFTTYSITAYLPHYTLNVGGALQPPQAINPSWIQTRPMPVNNEFAGGVSKVRVVVSPIVEFIPGVIRKPRPVPADFKVDVFPASDNDHYYEFWYQTAPGEDFQRAEQDNTPYLTGVSRFDDLTIYRWYVKWYCDRVLYNVALRNIDVQFTITES